jgi:hypothetical protein
MGKRQRLRKEVQSIQAGVAPVTLTLGAHKFRPFTNLDCAFGADLKDYPPYDAIPEEFRRGYTPANKVVSTLFYKGGSLDQFGLRLKAGVDRSAFYGALKSMLCSFAPKHEHKEAACAWLVAEYTEPT